MMKLEKLGYVMQFAGCISLAVMAFKSENERHKKAMECIELEAENLKLSRKCDEYLELSSEVNATTF